MREAQSTLWVLDVTYGYGDPNPLGPSMHTVGNQKCKHGLGQDNRRTRRHSAVQGRDGLRFCALVAAGRVKAQLSFETNHLRILRGQPRFILPALPDPLAFRGVPGPGLRVAHA